MWPQASEYPKPAATVTGVGVVSAGDRLKDEGKEVFEAFTLYRDQGFGRNLAKVAGELGKSPKLIERWSTRYRWVRRTNAWDSLLDRQKRLGELKQVEDMRKRQVKLGQLMQNIALTELEKMAKDANKKSKKRADLKENTILTLADAGSRLERTALGEPGDIVQNTGEAGQDLSVLASKDLKQLRAMRVKLRRKELADLEKKSGDDE